MRVTGCGPMCLNNFWHWSMVLKVSLLARRHGRSRRRKMMGFRFTGDPASEQMANEDSASHGLGQIQALRAFLENGRSREVAAD